MMSADMGGGLMGGDAGSSAPLSLVDMIKTADPALPDLVIAYMNANPQSVFTRDQVRRAALPPPPWLLPPPPPPFPD
jgi:hypothetical protein